ncbi:MAG: aldolase catalytic domain-containing protein [Phycisphaeraceae bacterium]|nr:aldolase catalytic domain-containing protein [Phycisphaeraceae bacterium]
MTDRAPWITYRPELKVLDCTIRDGGLMNNHQFDNDVVKAVYETCVEAGLDMMEIGYKMSRKQADPKKFGPFKFSDEESIRKIVGDNKTSLRLAVMADAGKCDYETDILPKEQSVIDVVRVATYVNQIPMAVDMIHDAHEKGYEVWCNIMAISIVQEPDLQQALEVLATTPASVVVVVDSFGALYREQVDYLVKLYQSALKGTGKEVGIHAHNNQQLAFANTIEAIILGCNRVDATMMGLGRGAGNCNMELLIGFLRNPKFRIRPIYKLLQDHMLKLREKMEWGPVVPYNISGLLNQHPRAAMAVRASTGPDKDDFVSFYDKCVSEV